MQDAPSDAWNAVQRIQHICNKQQTRVRFVEMHVVLVYNRPYVIEPIQHTVDNFGEEFLPLGTLADNRPLAIAGKLV
jgi:hypothetical protein